MNRKYDLKVEIMSTEKAIVFNVKDNVATATSDLAQGESITLQIDERSIPVTLVNSIPFGHKFSVLDIIAGSTIIKYGETIGLSTTIIKKGAHVHVHNVESNRGRGDRPENKK
jgi:altronate dehydratase small subunit